MDSNIQKLGGVEKLQESVSKGLGASETYSWEERSRALRSRGAFVKSIFQ